MRDAPPRDRPDAAELLAVARETFAREILPLLKDDPRVTALMVVSAMGIAERELRMPVGGLLDAGPLVEAIRAGRHDADGALWARLLIDATLRTALANPKALERAD